MRLCKIWSFLRQAWSIKAQLWSTIQGMGNSSITKLRVILFQNIHSYLPLFLGTILGIRSRQLVKGPCIIPNTICKLLLKKPCSHLIWNEQTMLQLSEHKLSILYSHFTLKMLASIVLSSLWISHTKISYMFINWKQISPFSVAKRINTIPNKAVINMTAINIFLLHTSLVSSLISLISLFLLF